MRNTYTIEDFTKMHPALAKKAPPPVLDELISLSLASINPQTFGKAWFLCVGLYTAHLLELLFKDMPDDNAESFDYDNIASMSVGGVSVSLKSQTDADNKDKTLGALGETAYGRQLMVFVKMAGLGGMVIV